jgi:hypothetical protein
MVLTFRSSTPEEIVIIERNEHGERVARARQGAENAKSWNLNLKHPSGMNYPGTFHGDRNTAKLALIQMMMDNENDFRSGATYSARTRDLNIRLTDEGNEFGNAPIKGIR